LCASVHQILTRELQKRAAGGNPLQIAMQRKLILSHGHKEM